MRRDGEGDDLLGVRQKGRLIWFSPLKHQDSSARLKPDTAFVLARNHRESKAGDVKALEARKVIGPKRQMVDAHRREDSGFCTTTGVLTGGNLY